MIVNFYERSGNLHVYAYDGTITVRKTLGISVDGFNWRQEIYSDNPDLSKLVLELKAECLKATSKAQIESLVSAFKETAQAPSMGNETVAAYFRTFIEQMEADILRTSKGRPLAEGTKVQYRITCKRYVEYSVHNPLVAATVDLYLAVTAMNKKKRAHEARTHFVGFFDYLINKGYAPGSQMIRHNNLRRFLRWMEEEEFIKIPFQVPMPEPDSRNVEVPIATTEALLNLPHIPDSVEGYWRGLAKLKVLGIMRISEALNTDIDDFDGNIVHIVQKGSRSIKKVIPPQYVETIQEGLKLKSYCPERNSTARSAFSAWLKGTVANLPEGKKKVKDYKKAPDGELMEYGGRLCDIITPHDLRGAGADYLAHLNVPQDMIRKQGGWKSDRVFRAHYEGSAVHKDVIADAFKVEKADPSED